jgi:hypothetical protein
MFTFSFTDFILSIQIQLIQIEEPIHFKTLKQTLLLNSQSNETILSVIGRLK